MSRPVLLATSESEPIEPYVEALKAVGVPAERLQPLLPSAAARRDAGALAVEAAGVVLCGGGDIHPRTFGEEPLPGSHLRLYEERDALELELLAGARQASVPVWGVCRGPQVINVFLGGSLWQDIPSQLSGASVQHLVPRPSDALVHVLSVETPASPMGEVLAAGQAMVNSRHHQAIKKLAPGLLAVARSADGLIEAVALRKGGWWVEGVQWHPENLLALAHQRRLWQRFAEAMEARERERAVPRA